MLEFPIPSLASLATIRQQIERGEEPEDEYHLNETSALTAGRHQAPINQLNASLNHIFRPRDPYFFLHPGRISIISDPATNYEHIFSTPGLSRRVGRVRLLDSSDSNPDEDFDWDSMEIMSEWFDQCLDDPYPHDGSLVPKALKHPTRKHDSALLDFLPERLRWNSEPGRFFKQRVRKLLEIPASQVGQLVEYEAEMGNGTKETVKNCFGESVEVLPFLGAAAEGHLIRKSWTGFPVVKGKGHKERMCRYAKMNGQLARADQALVELAKRIAGWVARKIVYEFVVPEAYRQGREVLGREQISRAVREILGEEWFDMPSDQTGKLRNWSVDEVFEPGVEIEVNGDGRVTNHVHMQQF